jgi:hypothetical protein
MISILYFGRRRCTPQSQHLRPFWEHWDPERQFRLRLKQYHLRLCCMNRPQTQAFRQHTRSCSSNFSLLRAISRKQRICWSGGSWSESIGQTVPLRCRMSSRSCGVLEPNPFRHPLRLRKIPPVILQRQLTKGSPMATPQDLGQTRRD